MTQRAFEEMVRQYERLVYTICCQMVHRPRVIVFDEPLVGLDPHAIKELKEMFGELRAQGRRCSSARI